LIKYYVPTSRHALECFNAIQCPNLARMQVGLGLAFADCASEKSIGSEIEQYVFNRDETYRFTDAKRTCTNLRRTHDLQPRGHVRLKGTSAIFLLTLDSTLLVVRPPKYSFRDERMIENNASMTTTPTRSSLDVRNAIPILLIECPSSSGSNLLPHSIVRSTSLEAIRIIPFRKRIFSTRSRISLASKTLQPSSSTSALRRGTSY